MKTLKFAFEIYWPLAYFNPWKYSFSHFHFNQPFIASAVLPMKNIPSKVGYFRKIEESFPYCPDRPNGMETSRGQWLLMDTFFQNGQILVDIFWVWLLVDIFCPWEFFYSGKFLWTFFWVSSGHFLMVITNSANSQFVGLG